VGAARGRRRSPPTHLDDPLQDTEAAVDDNGPHQPAAQEELLLTGQPAEVLGVSPLVLGAARRLASLVSGS
jgi:hypothetical protein